jgi:hypothetical protein
LRRLWVSGRITGNDRLHRCGDTNPQTGSGIVSGYAMTPFQIVAAVLAGNVLTMIWCWSLWRVGIFEKQGRQPSLPYLLVLAAIPLVMSYGFWTIE